MGPTPEPSLNDQLANAVTAVAVAHDVHAKMKERTAHARNNETDALNKVNDAQRHFDLLVAEVKKSAPRESDWKKPDPIEV